MKLRDYGVFVLEKLIGYKEVRSKAGVVECYERGSLIGRCKMKAVEWLPVGKYLEMVKRMAEMIQSKSVEESDLLFRLELRKLGANDLADMM